jgi:hypothetical protein
MQKLANNQVIGADSYLSKYGPLIGGTDLVRVLGFPNAAAFREAVRKGRIDLHLFTIMGRRGKFALTQDVLNWVENVSRQSQN